jgi:hypothetical protein
MSLVENPGENDVNSNNLEIIVDSSSSITDVQSYDIITNKEDYHIAICQDGKFAVTFDAGKFHYNWRAIKISIQLIFFFFFF